MAVVGSLHQCGRFGSLGQRAAMMIVQPKINNWMRDPMITSFIFVSSCARCPVKCWSHPCGNMGPLQTHLVGWAHTDTAAMMVRKINNWRVLLQGERASPEFQGQVPCDFVRRDRRCDLWAACLLGAHKDNNLQSLSSNSAC